MLEAIVATGKPVVLVLQNGRPLEHHLGGATCSGDSRSVVSRRISADAPSRKLFLATTIRPDDCRSPFPRSVGQIPSYYNHFPSKKDSYIEGDSSPLFVFGHGLSYTTFKYDDLTITAPKAHGTDDVLVSCKITNTGSRAGDEVAQLYVHQETASVVTPVKSLKGFLRIHLEPKESKTVTFHLKQSELRCGTPIENGAWNPATTQLLWEKIQPAVCPPSSP